MAIFTKVVRLIRRSIAGFVFTGLFKCNPFKSILMYDL